MTQSTAVYTDCTESGEAGEHLGRQIREGLSDLADAVILFASSRFDYEALLSSLDAACQPGLLVGASSAGEFTSTRRGEGTACALAFRSSEIKVAAGLGRGVTSDRSKAVQDVVAAFRGSEAHGFPYRSALVMTDALAGHADDLVDQLTVKTAGQYQFAGGGAGDDAQFSRTHVFFGTKAYTDAVVALEVLSTKPTGIGVGHGWSPASEAFRVTAVEGTRLISLNGMPAVEAFEAHARSLQQTCGATRRCRSSCTTFSASIPAMVIACACPSRWMRTAPSPVRRRSLGGARAHHEDHLGIGGGRGQARDGGRDPAAART